MAVSGDLEILKSYFTHQSLFVILHLKSYIKNSLQIVNLFFNNPKLTNLRAVCTYAARI